MSIEILLIGHLFKVLTTGKLVNLHANLLGGNLIAVTLQPFKDRQELCARDYIVPYITPLKGSALRHGWW